MNGRKMDEVEVAGGRGEGKKVEEEGDWKGRNGPQDQQ